ncbi:VWA domain-containing protein [Nocardia implantans]|uniref:VWA domain-containing protein n=1 Tax=Nocardia implantans TaxID=3108168 RepID=A0ABU6AV02_9NOCA|nr:MULTISPECIES: VWA domain-containing protein [unclassified Nocardia]MBF6192668.1 VWA domain-containing protein [Nocardia beijingensis]MEA3527424.1 VWA domain-containing protein [Nocardia sp. CDC192]MEB3511132.1 VWA domain-containing protein [Nocardia sp. CDC186]
MSISHFTAQIWLGFLVVIALIALGYVLVQRNRRKHMLQFTNMELLEKVAPSRPGPFRHVAVALLLVGLAFLTVAAAGPTAVKKVPRNRATVMLVMDVSLSMEATDVAPSRIQVAKKAGKEFVDGLPEGVNIGFVTFAGTASVMVSPTTNHESVKAAIDNVRLAERTATGEGILTALQAIETLATVLGGAQEPPPARIVLMSDGKQTVPDFKDVDNPRHEYVAARLAKSKNVPISTISFGTRWGVVEIPREDGSKDQVRVEVDDDAMREIARLSSGEFYTASSLQELTKVYDTLEQQIGYELTRGDASRPWLLLGLVVVAAGVVIGLVYRQRLP